MDLTHDLENDVLAEDATSEIDRLHEEAEDLAAQATVDPENATELRRRADDLVRRAAHLRAEIEEI